MKLDPKKLLRVKLLRWQLTKVHGCFKLVAIKGKLCGWQSNIFFMINVPTGACLSAVFRAAKKALFVIPRTKFKEGYPWPTPVGLEGGFRDTLHPPSYVPIKLWLNPQTHNSISAWKNLRCKKSSKIVRKPLSLQIIFVVFTQKTSRYFITKGLGHGRLVAKLWSPVSAHNCQCPTETPRARKLCHMTVQVRFYKKGGFTRVWDHKGRYSLGRVHGKHILHLWNILVLSFDKKMKEWTFFGFDDFFSSMFTSHVYVFISISPRCWAVSLFPVKLSVAPRLFFLRHLAIDDIYPHFLHLV